MSEERRQNVFTDDDRKTLYRIDGQLEAMLQTAQQSRETLVNHEHRIAKVEGKAENHVDHEDRIRILERGMIRFKTIWSGIMLILGVVGAVIVEMLKGFFTVNHPK